jgi:hypothetical protein
MEPDDKQPAEETVKIGLERDSAELVDRMIKAGDLIAANEHGYHRGYCRAIRDCLLALFLVSVMAFVFEKTFREI